MWLTYTTISKSYSKDTGKVEVMRITFKYITQLAQRAGIRVRHCREHRFVYGSRGYLVYDGGLFPSWFGVLTDVERYIKDKYTTPKGNIKRKEEPKIQEIRGVGSSFSTSFTTRARPTWYSDNEPTEISGF
jgi:hypothetical protein